MGSFDKARIAAALAKTHSARAYTPDEIAKDAHAVASMASRAREAAAVQSSIRPMIKELSCIAERYGADVVAPGCPDSMIVGLRFRGCTYSGAARHVFRLA